jgi:hypothetical protein
MQGHHQSAPLDRPSNPPLLGPMPYHPEAEPMLADKAEAVRQANQSAAMMNGRTVDSATHLAKRAVL